MTHPAHGSGAGELDLIEVNRAADKTCIGIGIPQIPNLGDIGRIDSHLLAKLHDSGSFGSHSRFQMSPGELQNGFQPWSMAVDTE